MTMNALNGFESDTYILQIVTQNYMADIFGDESDFEDIKFPVKFVCQEILSKHMLIYY